MVDLKNGLTMVALFSQWAMTVFTMALFLDPNLCALFSAILLFVNADLFGGRSTINGNPEYNAAPHDHQGGTVGSDSEFRQKVY